MNTISAWQRPMRRGSIRRSNTIARPFRTWLKTLAPLEPVDGLLLPFLTCFVLVVFFLEVA